jgi:hypothetical protein
MRRLIIAALTLAPALAHAGGTTTLTTTPQTIVAAADARSSLVIQVQSPTQVACTVDGTLPAISDGAAWQFSGASGITGWQWSAPSPVPAGPVRCVAAADSPTSIVMVQEAARR